MKVIYFNEESKQLAQEEAAAQKISNVIEKIAIGACLFVSVFAIAIICTLIF